MTTRAAQYLRMSTEHQRYSLQAQAEAIATFAAGRGYELTRSYFDPGRSGLTFKERKGLQALLSDALDPQRDFSSVLVLDVSRWGRFQDHDEAAHYEFVCRNAGVQVIYCAEPFENDQSAVSSLMKKLKRLMAAEFSRELSEKVRQVQVRQARLGRHPRGRAVYAVRRVALDRDGQVRQVLGPGERKIVAGDNVVLQPGPSDERAIIQLMFRWFLHDDCGVSAIAQELNRRNISSPTRRPWTRYVVDGLLRNELMIGVSTFNRTTQVLRTGASPVPRDAWIRVKVFEPIISPRIFRKAQAKLADRGRIPRAAMVTVLTRVWRRHGRLSAALVDSARDAPSSTSYARRFGSLRNAYAAVGYAAHDSAEQRRAFQSRLIEHLREAYGRHGYISESVIAADPALACGATYRRHFGSLRRAYALAGLPFTNAELNAAGRARGVARRAAGEACGRARVNDADLLAGLRRLHAKRGYVSISALKSDATNPSPAILRYRFGSLLAAYAQAGLPSDQKELQLAGARRWRKAKGAGPSKGGRR